VDALFLKDVCDFNAADRKMLGKLKDSVRIGEQFSTELYIGVRRRYDVWSLPMPIAVVFPLVCEMHPDLVPV
jgi:hypothetical protein